MDMRSELWDGGCGACAGPVSGPGVLLCDGCWPLLTHQEITWAASMAAPATWPEYVRRWRELFNRARERRARATLEEVKS